MNEQIHSRTDGIATIAPHAGVCPRWPLRRLEQMHEGCICPRSAFCRLCSVLPLSTVQHVIRPTSGEQPWSLIFQRYALINGKKLLTSRHNQSLFIEYS